MSFPVRIIAGSTPVVLDSPHSGVDYPDDFGYACDRVALRQAEDTHVERLYDFGTALGAAWVEALFPRSYLDVNRNTTEIDVTLFDEAWPDPVETDPHALAKVRLGKGLVWRMTDDGLPIYARRLSVPEVRSRIENCWLPYHEAVRTAVAAAHARHGYSIHLNCHSMPAIASRYSSDFPGLVHPDFVIGDRDGTTAAPALSRKVCDYLQSLGYSVSYNHPYKGVELVRRYGDPQRHRHSLQIEINRKLYMDERTLELREGVEPLKRHLRLLVEMLLRTDPRQGF
jgi:N-formylglutamate deformylase